MICQVAALISDAVFYRISLVIVLGVTGTLLSVGCRSRLCGHVTERDVFQCQGNGCFQHTW